MAEKITYPQIPSTVWWGVRSLLQRSPNATVDERTLGVQLDVQEVAARQYTVELRRVGILTDENKASALAQKWRHDDTYREAVDEIVANAYPESLIQIAPPGDADRQKVISWFMREGLGTGAAKNKAGTYMLISSADPNDAPSRGSGGSSAPQKRDPGRARRSDGPKPPQQSKAAGAPAASRNSKGGDRGDQIPLNVNVQIHISADASGDQIESIFAAMRRYLYDGNAS